MGVARIQVTLNRRTGLPEDRVVNGFHFANAIANVDATAADGLMDAVEIFYAAIDQLLGRQLSGTGTIACYDLADATPRVPVLERNITPLTTAVGGLVSEIACCLSYQAAPISGTPQARRRGRVFLGPLASSAWTQSDANDEPRPATAAVNTVLTAAQTMAHVTIGADLWDHGTFSDTGYVQGAGDPFAFFAETAEFWIDDAFDVQRRRGVAPGTRTSVSV